MTTPRYLHNLGLPESVQHVIHVLSGADQFQALRLVELYNRNSVHMLQLEAEKVLSERRARAAIELRAKEDNRAEVTRARRVAATRSAVLELIR